MQGDTLRRFKTPLDTAFNSAIWWGMDTKGVRFPSKNDPAPDQEEAGGGPQVLPGEYWVKVKYLDWSDSMRVKVIDDPRLNNTTADRIAKNAAVRDLYQVVERCTKAYDRLKEVEKTIILVESQFVNVPDSSKKEILKLGAALKDSISSLKEKFFQHKEEKGIKRGADNLNSKLYAAFGYINGNKGAPNNTVKTSIATAKTTAESIIDKVNVLLDTQWKEYQLKAEAIKYSLFKKFERI